jgi:glycosyltransferase involved in cell wall biosynthesis
MNVSPPATPKRILYVITKSNWGGAQRYVYDLATAVQNKGYTVLVATGGEGELTERLREAGVPLSPISSMQRDINIGGELATFKALIRIMRDFRPDVVHINSSKAGGLGALAARYCRVKKVIFTAHGWAFNEDRPAYQKLVIWYFHYITILLNHLTICVSESTKRDTRFMPFIQKYLHVIHLGVQPVDFVEREVARIALAPGVSEKTWIGSIAELHPIKQFPVLIRSFVKIAAAHPDVTLVIIGEGQERLKLEKLIADLSLDGRVILAGHVAQAARYLKAFDVFVLPSRSESFGYVIAEAGLAGLPVVASAVGGIPEIITSEEDGILVPSRDEAALENALVRVIEDTALRTKLGEALKYRIEHDFSTTSMIAKTFALY